MTGMSLTESDLKHVLNLAHLEISDDETPAYLDQLNKVLDNMKCLDQLDLNHLEPLTGPIENQKTPMREDAALDTPHVLSLSDNAPE